MAKRSVGSEEQQLEMVLPVVRHPLSRRRVTFSTDGESKTHQAHVPSCDVNAIVARYQRTGEMPPARYQGVYADVTGLQGDMTERVVNAKSVINTFEEFSRSYVPPKADDVVEPKKE